jgi:polyprenyl P-hydroxybenzoate/phenylacrylic acid decarboxylase-like protein
LRTVVALTGASGIIHGVDFLKRCPGEKYLVISDWGKAVLKMETGLTPEDLAPHCHKIFSNKELAAPFSSGSNPFDWFVVNPCSVSTLAKIAAGIADTLITRVAEVALKERRKIVLALRETPLSSIALENALKLSREGVIIMPIAPPFYTQPKMLEDNYRDFSNKILRLMGVEIPGGWREEEL